MAVTTTPRFALPHWSEGSDEYPGRIGFNEILDLLEDKAAIAFPSGTLADRPKSGTFGRFYLATDQGGGGGRLYYDGGAGWIELNTTGGGGAGRRIVVGGSGAEGTSVRAARADHTHDLPLATAANHGAMASQWAALMEGAAVIAAGSTLVLRDSAGRINAGTPTVSSHVATRGYVDTTAGTFHATPDTLVRRYNNGHFRVNPSNPGPDDAISPRYIDNNSTWDATPNTLARRGSDGTFYVAEPTKAENPATKRYVDSRTSRRAWKTDVTELDYGLEQLAQLPLSWWTYTEDAPATGSGAGPMVEDVAAVMPRMVNDGADGAPERIRDRDMLWVAVRAIQQQAAQIEALRAEVSALRSEVAERQG